MRLTPNAQGVFPIAPTAFHPDGRIDTASMDRLTDFYVACGATGVTVLGQMGEAPKLSHGESVAITTQMIRRAPSLPVIVGVSSPGFASMHALTQEVMAAGAAAVMIGPPNTLRTDDQVINYYRQAADALGVSLPQTAGAAQLMQACAAHGMADLDHSALVRALEIMAAHQVAPG